MAHSSFRVLTDWMGSLTQYLVGYNVTPSVRHADIHKDFTQHAAGEVLPLQSSRDHKWPEEDIRQCRFVSVYAKSAFIWTYLITAWGSHQNYYEGQTNTSQI